MSFLLEMALANLIVAAILALFAALAGLWGRRPAVTHALWLLVLVKLITPPFFEYPIPWAAPPREPVAFAKLDVDGEPAPVQVEAPNLPIFLTPQEEEMPPLVLPEVAFIPLVLPEDVQPFALDEVPHAARIANPVQALAPAGSWPWIDLIAIVWMIGSCVWLTLALWRLWRFQRWMRFAEPAPAFVQELAHELADCLQVRCPGACVIPGNVSPMLWTLGRATRLLLPTGLLDRLPADQLATLLAHELAHWRRRDDRVRWLEFVVLALYWWCPLVWWARRELHQAEEECCDAWVVSILPDSAKTYALALVETVDFLSDAPADLPLLASGLGRVRLLKRRLTMILQGKTPRALTFTGLLGVAAVGLLLLPMVPGWAQSQRGDQPGKKDEKKFDRKKDLQGDPNHQEQLERVREEVLRLHQELEKRQQEVQKRAEELHRLMQQLRQVEGDGGKKGGPDGGKKGGPDGQDKKGGPGGQGGDKKKGGPGGQGGDSDFQKKKGGPAFSPDGRHVLVGAGPMEQRLAEVERKLDMLLQEVRALRGDMKKGPKGPGGNPRPNFEQNLNPPPDNFEPNNPPQPPNPPRLPLPPREDKRQP